MTERGAEQLWIETHAKTPADLATGPYKAFIAQVLYGLVSDFAVATRILVNDLAVDARIG